MSGWDPVLLCLLETETPSERRYQNKLFVCWRWEGPASTPGGPAGRPCPSARSTNKPTRQRLFHRRQAVRSGPARCGESPEWRRTGSSSASLLSVWAAQKTNSCQPLRFLASVSSCSGCWGLMWPSLRQQLFCYLKEETEYITTALLKHPAGLVSSN